MATEDEERARLQRLAARLAVALSPASTEALLAYGRLLLEWNQHINLTGADSLTELIEEHFADAFAVAGQLAAALRVVDVGSGGGLPAIPAALLSPDASFVLLEPTQKKAAFLRTAVRVLGLRSRVSVFTERLQRGEIPGGQAFDVAMSRATFAPDQWIALAEGVVRPGGRIFALASSPTIVPSPGLRLESIVEYGSGTRRWLLVLIRST